jgi:hypothetical protein
MKLKFIIFSVFALVLSLGGVSSAYAEIDEVEQADVPFDFYAGSTKMPAGTYNIGLDAQSDTIKVSDASGKSAVLLLGSPADGKGKKTQLVFDRSGDTYFLREIDNNVINLSVSEDKSAKDGGAEPSRVNVSAN